MFKIWFEQALMHFSIVEDLFSGFYHKTCCNCSFAFILTFTTMMSGVTNEMTDFDVAVHR